MQKLAQARALGWVTDDNYHVVITETGVEVAQGDLRYPSIATGHVEFPSSAAASEAWEGWIDGVNIGTASGTFKFRLSSSIGCTDQLIPDTDPIVLAPGEYAIFRLTGTGPADCYICLMREVL